MMIKSFLILILLSFFSSGILAQENNKNKKSEAELRVVNEEKAKKNEITFFQDAKTSIRDPFNLRDPFRRKREIIKGRKKKYGKLVDDSFSNLPTIDGLKLADIRIVGILLGKTRRAIAKSIGKDQKTQTFIIKEGMKIGENQAEVKAILPGGVVLVERIVSVYDQDEYLETILPISSE